MGKNGHIHFVIETELLNKLKKEAQLSGNISLAELCRRKLNNQPIQEEILVIRDFIQVIKRRGLAK